MKKIFAVLLLAMVIFSLPVFAETNGTNNQNPTPKQLIASRAISAADEYKETRQNVIVAKQGYANALELYNTRKDQYLQLKTTYQSATPAQQELIKAQIRVKAKETLSQQAEILIQKINTLEEQGIAPENSEELIATLEEIQVLLLDQNASKEDIINSLKEIRDQIIPELKYQTQLRAAKALDNKIASIINKSEVFEERTAELITNLSEKGFDTTELELALSNFQAEMEQIKIYYEEARAKWDSAETDANKHAVLKEGFDLAKEINKMVIEAHQELKQAFTNMKQTMLQAATNSQNPETDMNTETNDDNNTPGDEEVEGESDEESDDE